MLAPPEGGGRAAGGRRRRSAATKQGASTRRPPEDRGGGVRRGRTRQKGGRRKGAAGPCRPAQVPSFSAGGCKAQAAPLEDGRGRPRRQDKDTEPQVYIIPFYQIGPQTSAPHLGGLSDKMNYVPGFRA